MRTTHKRKNWILPAIVGAVMIPGSAMTAQAAEEEHGTSSPLPIAGIESVLEECYEVNVKENIDLYLVPTEQGEYVNRAFSNTSDFTYIRSAPDETSDWTGKLYSDSTATVLEYSDGWIKIQSGNAVGYVPDSALYTGDEAQRRAEEYEKPEATVLAQVLNVRSGQGTDTAILTQVTFGQQYEVTGDAVDNWYPVKAGATDGWVSGEYIEISTDYSYGETREEESRRIAEETAAVTVSSTEAIDTEAVLAGKVTSGVGNTENATGGQAVIDFACQFIGNPYVWGGTSLTNGADCSGFVQAVYANFGISLPRTTWDMVGVGYEVSYDEALPGDIVLYDGHVGLYMGDGNIVNAMNETDGIGICSAQYAPIVTIRRVL